MGEASIFHKCHPYLVVLEMGGLGEAAELGLVGAAETGLEAGEERGVERREKKNQKSVKNVKIELI